jgi:hypothetical protein
MDVNVVLISSQNNTQNMVGRKEAQGNITTECHQMYFNEWLTNKENTEYFNLGNNSS